VQKVFLYDPTLIHNTFVTNRQTNGQTRDKTTMVPSTPAAVFFNLFAAAEPYISVTINAMTMIS